MVKYNLLLTRKLCTARTLNWNSIVNHAFLRAGTVGKILAHSAPLCLTIVILYGDICIPCVLVSVISVQLQLNTTLCLLAWPRSGIYKSPMSPLNAEDRESGVIKYAFVLYFQYLTRSSQV